MQDNISSNDYSNPFSPNLTPHPSNPTQDSSDQSSFTQSTNQDNDFAEVLKRYRAKLNAPKQSNQTNSQREEKSFLSSLRYIQDHEEDPEETERILQDFINGNNKTEQSIYDTPITTYYDDFINDICNGNIPDDIFEEDIWTDTSSTEKPIEEIIKSLSINQRIKNYKELCSIFNMKVSNGNTKIAQLKNIAQYVNLEKIGHSFIVKEIYPVSILKNDKRSFGNHSVYYPFIEKLLMNYIAKRNNRIEISKSELLLQLDIINERLDDLFSNRLSLFKLQEIIPNLTQTELQKFESYLLNKIYNIFNNAIKIMIKKNMIIYNEMYYSVKKQYLGNDRSFLLHQEVITDPQIIQSIKEIEHDGTFMYLLNLNLYDHYKEFVNHEIEKEYGWDGVNKKIIISINNPFKINDNEISLIKNSLNKKMIEYFENTFKKRCKSPSKQSIYLELVSIFLKENKYIQLNWNNLYKTKKNE